jgi:pyruvate-formate lyase
MSTIKKSMIDFSNINLVPGKTLQRNKIDHNLQNEYEKFINKDDDINDLTADATSPLPNDDD